MGEGIKSKSWIHELLCGRNCWQISKGGRRSRQKCVCVQLDVSRGWIYSQQRLFNGQVVKVSVPEDTFGVERLCDNECEGCEQTQDVYCWS
jgi:hypothetical protein